jgi:hypothetical protein
MELSRLRWVGYNGMGWDTVEWNGMECVAFTFGMAEVQIQEVSYRVVHH